MPNRLLRHVFILWLAATHCAATAYAADGEPAALRTDHYSLYTEGLDVEDVGRMLEAYHGQLSDFFDAAPQGPLRVEVYSTHDRFESALRKAGLSTVKAGGFYSLRTHKAYLWVQPSDYFTRQLILHECAHQFHYLVACGGKDTRLPMYAEGLAEHLAMHSWDGKTLRIGIVPEITLEDYPVKSLARFRDVQHRELDAMVTGRVGVEHAESWAVVHFLINRYPAQFKKWSAALNGQAEPAEAWERAFGKVTPALVEEMESYVQGHPQPWHIESISWQQWGDAIEGRAQNNRVAVALLKETPRSLSVRVEPLDRPLRAGLTFGHTSPRDYSLLQLHNDRHIELLRFAAGQWRSEGTWPLPAPHEGGDELSLEIDPSDGRSTVTLRANGKELKRVGAAGQVGLHIQQGRALFHMR